MASKAEKLAKKLLGSNNIKSIENDDRALTKRYKIVVFVPPEKTDELSFALASAGAGVIGNYTVCSFRSRGIGTFTGNEQSSPTIGAKEKFQMVEEYRLEMICDKKNLKKAVDKLYEVHPYDEPAFEIYEVLTSKKKFGIGITKVALKNKTGAKGLLKKINPDIDQSVLPKDLKKIKITDCIIDFSNNEDLRLEDFPRGILYIKRNKKNLKAYIT